MQVADGLPRRGAVVDADVVAGRSELRLELPPCLFKQLEHGDAFLSCRVEERRHMAQWDHESVPLSNREGVTEGDCKLVSDQYSGLGQAAEGAGDAVVHGARVKLHVTVWMTAIALASRSTTTILAG